MSKLKHILVVLCVVLALAVTLSVLATNTKATTQTPTVVYTCGTVQAEGSIHVDTFADATAALREKSRQWKSDDVVEIQFIGDISGGAQNGVLFRLETIWREDGTKLPIIIRGVGSIPDDSFIYLDGIGGWYACANDYTFMNLTMPIGSNTNQTDFYAGSGNVRFENVNFKQKTVRVPTREAQIAMHSVITDLGDYICTDPNNLITPEVSPLPCADAWELARQRNWEIGEGMFGVGGNYYGDYLHDGDTGGGQYLNGCIYFEVLTGISCVGNTWRPTAYSLSEDMITFLQNVAHDTVVEIYGEEHFENPVTDVVGNDGWMNVLIMGSSNNGYLRDETCAIAKTAGVNMRLVHAYYSGVAIATQWSFVENDSKEYLVHYNENFTTLPDADKQAYTDFATQYQWDAIITYQCSTKFYTEINTYLENPESGFAAALEKAEKADELINHVYANSGLEGTKYYWFTPAAQPIGAGNADDNEYGRFFADTPTSAVFAGWDELEPGERVSTSLTFGSNVDYQSYNPQIGAVGYLQDAPATPFTATTAVAVTYPAQEGYENVPDIRPVDVDASIIADGNSLGLGRLYCKIGYAPSNGNVIIKNGTIDRFIGTIGSAPHYGDISVQVYGGTIQAPQENRQSELVQTSLNGNAELIIAGGNLVYGVKTFAANCTVNGDATVDVRDGTVGYRFYLLGSNSTGASVTGTATFKWSGGNIVKPYFGRGTTFNKLVCEFSTNPDAQVAPASGSAIPLGGYEDCVVNGDIEINYIGQIPSTILSKTTMSGGDGNHSKVIKNVKADAQGNVQDFSSFVGGFTAGTVTEVVNNIEAGNFTAFTGASGSATGTTKITNNISGGTFSANTNFGGVDNAAVKTTITGGTFAFDPSEYLPAGYVVAENGDNTYTVDYLYKPGLYVFENPTKTVYRTGESLRTEGLVLLLIQKDGTISLVDQGYTVTGFDSSAVGKNTLTIAYEGDTVELNVAIVDDAIAAADNEGNVYTDIDDAVEDCAEGGKITLVQNVAGDIAVSKDLCLDLNGMNIGGTVTVAEGCTLYGMDAKTDDYTVEDGEGYGKIKVTGQGEVAGLPEDSDLAKDGYLMVTETLGGEEYVSFHRVNLQITHMTLRAEDTGVYFKSEFAGDELVAQRVQKFGVVMSVTGDPTEEDLQKTGTYSWFTGFEAGRNLGDNTSTLLHGVLSSSNKTLINKRNANMPVYGRSYILLDDGETYMLGGAVQRTFREQVEGADAIWNELGTEQQASLVEMLEEFEAVMTGWNIPAIRTAAGE